MEQRLRGQIVAPCEHIAPGPGPYRVTLVLDDHLGPTEALVHCKTCEQAYLIELLDWQGAMRLFRVAAPDGDATALLLKDLERGSCDVNRAGEEVRQFTLDSQPLPVLWLVDTSARELVGVIDTTGLGTIPTRGWRELPCDGDWIERVQRTRL